MLELMVFIFRGQILRSLRFCQTSALVCPRSTCGKNNPRPFRRCFSFGTDDDIRLSHATSMADIEKGLARIDKFCRTLVK
jgi:hypothetical protein